jgi:trk system potassium uptake protein TrkH
MSQQIEATRLVTMGLMFIGGSPGSTAGGVKTTTLLVLLLTLAAIIRGRPTTLYGVRAIPETIVREAITIFLLAICFVAGIFGLLLLTEAPPPGGSASFPLLFETISAFGTVGLSLNLTPHISSLGRVLLMLAMFVGRLGPLTVVLIVGSSSKGEYIHHPEEEVVVG